MSLLSWDWLPWRFWLAATSGTVILVFGLLAVGAIDESAIGDVVGMSVAPQRPEAASKSTVVFRHPR